MILFNAGNIGRKIANARKTKNLTQLELADYLGVRYQAVSNWERGQSMPDIEKLADLAEILDLSLDDLLDRPKATAEINALQDQNEVVSEETLTEYAPLMKPQNIATKLTNVTLDLEHLKALAPFLTSELLAELLTQALPEKNDFQQLASFAPFLPEEQLQYWIDVTDLEQLVLHFKEIAPLLPFLSKATNDRLLVQVCQTEDLSRHDLRQLLPFVSRAALFSLLQKTPLDVELLQTAAPFLGKTYTTKIFQDLLAKGEAKAVKGLLPFVDSEVLLTAGTQKHDPTFFKASLPFLKKEQVDQLFKEETTQHTLEDDALKIFLPFVSKETLFQYVQGQLAKNPASFFNELKVAFPFLNQSQLSTLFTKPEKGDTPHENF